MNSKEQLENEVQSLYNNYYYDLHNKKQNMKDTINGCLNRIAVSDDNCEVDRHYNILIGRYILEYKNITRECHKAWNEYHDKWIKWVEVKNNERI